MPRARRTNSLAPTAGASSAGGSATERMTAVMAQMKATSAPRPAVRLNRVLSAVTMAVACPTGGGVTGPWIALMEPTNW